ncbi:MAG: S41 family peptidase [Alphaproteobacteria bacterium]
MRGVAIGMAAGVALTATAVFGLQAFAPSAQAVGADTYRELNLFGDVFERVRSDYVEPVDDSKLIDSAINGMLTSLDPHSSYMDAETYKEMQVQTRGEFGGLGIEVTMEDGLVKVVSPFDDTPAQRAGIKPGDLISQINGQPIQGMTLNQAVDLMRGPVNSPITVTILRKDTQPFDVTMKRDIVRIKSVKSMLKGDVGSIRITTFNEQTDTGLEKAIASINQQAGGAKKISGYVLDLRNNPGGLLDQAISVCDAFLDHGEVVSTRGRRADDIQRYNARSGDLIAGKQIVVLTNGGSASASEIVAGALQDHQRATVMGTRSFGKGSVQTIIPLSGGADGAMRLTTARYYTPSGRSIQATGIDPDIVVEQPGVRGEEETGNGESKLPNHLANPTGAKGPTPKANAPQALNTPIPIPLPPAKPTEKDPITGMDKGVPDVQLDAALKFLHEGPAAQAAQKRAAQASAQASASAPGSQGGAGITAH